MKCDLCYELFGGIALNNHASLSYNRRLGMISEAHDLCVEGRRVSHSWCMCVVSHGYGGLGGGRDEGGG